MSDFAEREARDFDHYLPWREDATAERDRRLVQAILRAVDYGLEQAASYHDEAAERWKKNSKRKRLPEFHESSAAAIRVLKHGGFLE